LKVAALVLVLYFTQCSIPNHKKQKLTYHLIKSVDSTGNILFNHSGDTLFYSYTKNDLTDIIQKGVENIRFNFIYDSFKRISEEKIFESVHPETPFQIIKVNYNKDGLIDNLINHEFPETTAPDGIFQFEYKDGNIYKLSIGSIKNSQMDTVAEYTFKFSNGNIERMIIKTNILHGVKYDTINLSFDGKPNYFKNFFEQPVIQACAVFPINDFFIINSFSKNNLIGIKYEKDKDGLSYNYFFDNKRNILMVEEKMDGVLLTYSKYFFKQVIIQSTQ
jgi:hypothetical protein